MLLQSLRAHCAAPGWSGSICKNLEALVRSPGVSGRVACFSQPDFHFADTQCCATLVASVFSMHLLLKGKSFPLQLGHFSSV